jgi:hypothetical protein
MEKEEKIRRWIGQVTLIQFFYLLCVGGAIGIVHTVVSEHLNNFSSLITGGVTLAFSIIIFETLSKIFILRLVDVVIFSQLSRWVLKCCAYSFFFLVIFRHEWYGWMDNNLYLYSYYVISLWSFLWAAECSEKNTK